MPHVARICIVIMHAAGDPVWPKTDDVQLSSRQKMNVFFFDPAVVILTAVLRDTEGAYQFRVRIRMSEVN